MTFFANISLVGFHLSYMKSVHAKISYVVKQMEAFGCNRYVTQEGRS